MIIRFLLPICLGISAVSTEQCGVNMYDNEPQLERVVGGRLAVRGEFPWQVSLQLNHPHHGKIPHWCGGVIVDKQWVLTAAHCVINPLFVLVHPQFWKVRVGEHNLKQYENSEKTVEVSHVYYYPWYQGYNNDLALFRLKEPLEFNNYVKPICLADKVTQFSGMKCFASGWGKTDYHSKASDVLRTVEIKVFNNRVCDAAYREKFKIPIKQFHVCAGEVVGGKGTCMGDSGGPLACMKSGKWQLLGLTSFGSGCAKPGFPDVYTRVPEFIQWIKEKMALHP
ncbi:transmembrane protease serine 3-like [Centruroides sculpturatus]|uniref:transmembrane protease serine 3-like n=1 Tax=Centruroides sculpturatus TaxID=218467 RepID=UPI000C6E7F7F|nr:transmembrane protease serine 3-like [Centruroides sculpturatus]